MWLTDAKTSHPKSGEMVSLVYTGEASVTTVSHFVFTWLILCTANLFIADIYSNRSTRLAVNYGATFLSCRISLLLTVKKQKHKVISYS